MEGLIASAVLSAVVLSVIWPFTAAAQHARQNRRAALAAELGRELMEEILALPSREPDDAWTDVGPDAGETDREDFDDVDDYHGFHDADNEIRRWDGTQRNDPDSDGLARSVRVEEVYLPGQDPSGEPDVLCVQVRVTHHGRELLNLSRLVYEVQ
jgi:hypothetical protein